VTPSGLILPMFVREGGTEPQPIGSMPGVVQHTLDSLTKAAHEAIEAGVGGLMLFGVPARKDARGSGADAPDGILNLALRRLRSEFADSMEHIPTNLLADRLKRLEDAGIVASSAYQDNPPRHEYRLTPTGEALRPVMQELVNWGRRHLPGTMVRAEATGNAADSPFLPGWIKLPRRPGRP